MRAGLWQGGSRKTGVKGNKKTRILQRLTGFVHVFVQARKTLKAAVTKSDNRGKKCPSNVWLDICSLALWLVLSHRECLIPCSLNNVSLLWFGIFALNITLKMGFSDDSMSSL